ncbi:MAG: DUF6261 family protein [Tannerella sp.]|jgi:hypothetical protein|nr:DUF6261 family protein [Tannerella sp.]
METELRKPNVSRYSNAEHIEFSKISNVIFEKNKDLIDAPALLTAYQAKVMQEDHVYKWLRRSEFTEKKAETDRERDKILLEIVALLHVFEKHFNPSLRDNAKHVLNLVGNYRHLTHSGYDAETAGIDSILEKLNSADYIPAVQNLNLGTWLAQLAQLNSQFKNYADDAAQEQIKKPDINTKAARRETDGALRRITLRITSLIDLNSPANYPELVREFNVHVEHYNTLVHEHYGRLHAKTDISQGEIAPVEVQRYTGKPVYVIPSVKVRKETKDGAVTVVELVFSQDFTVGYRNNVAPGTATLIIDGIGKYVGEIVTTFNIVAIEA